MLDETEFLSHVGVRAISRHHLDHPYMLELVGMRNEVRYEPGESLTGLFGSNSNWRGPTWFPVSCLLVESLEQFHRYYGDDFRIECPIGSGRSLSLAEIADVVAERLASNIRRDADGRRPVFGDVESFHCPALAGLDPILRVFPRRHRPRRRRESPDRLDGPIGLSHR